MTGRPRHGESYSAEYRAWQTMRRGLGPENVASVVASLSTEAPYWIDMETGVRDSQGRFSIERCRQVCEAVYGPPGSAA